MLQFEELWIWECSQKTLKSLLMYQAMTEQITK